MEAVLKWLESNWPFFLVLSLLGALLIFLLISFIVEHRRHASQAEKMLDQNSSARTYFIDLTKNQVRYFNTTNLGDVRTVTVTRFYSQFPQPGQRKVIDWVKELAYGAEGAESYIEVPVNISRTNKQALSMLQVDHVDTESGTLRISSFLLNYVPTGSKKTGAARHIQTLEEYKDAVTPYLKKKKGVTACFCFLYRRRNEVGESIDHVIMSQLRNALNPLLFERRVLLSPSENEIVLCDPALLENQPQKAMMLIREASNLITSYLALNSYLTEIDFRCGAVFHRDEADAEAILEKSRETARFAFDGKERVLVYEKGKSLIPSVDATYRTEIERIINEKKINFYFRPIVSVEKNCVVGYFTKSEPTDTYFATMDEVKNYALRSGDSDSLFSTVFRRTLPLFINQRENEDQLLYFPVRVDDLPYMMRVVSKSVKARETKIVFLFNETDLRDHINFVNPGSFIEELTHIKAKGHKVGLLIDKAELGLPELIYQGFDSFACSFALANAATLDMDARIRVLLHALPERLLRYNKPIIATDIESWGAIGIIVHSGIKLLSSEVIGRYDEMIDPLGPKTLRKLKDVSR